MRILFLKNQQEEVVAEIHSALSGFFAFKLSLLKIFNIHRHMKHVTIFFITKTELKRGQRFLRFLFLSKTFWVNKAESNA